MERFHPEQWDGWHSLSSNVLGLWYPHHNLLGGEWVSSNWAFFVGGIHHRNPHCGWYIVIHATGYQCLWHSGLPNVDSGLCCGLRWCRYLRVLKETFMLDKLKPLFTWLKVLGVGVSFAVSVHHKYVTIEQFNSFLSAAAIFITSTCGVLYGLNKAGSYMDGKNDKKEGN
jgi:hypothetical protein